MNSGQTYNPLYRLIAADNTLSVQEAMADNLLVQ